MRNQQQSLATAAIHLLKEEESEVILNPYRLNSLKRNWSELNPESILQHAQPNLPFSYCNSNSWASQNLQLDWHRDWFTLFNKILKNKRMKNDWKKVTSQCKFHHPKMKMMTIRKFLLQTNQSQDSKRIMHIWTRLSSPQIRDLGLKEFLSVNWQKKKERRKFENIKRKSWDESQERKLDMNVDQNLLKNVNELKESLFEGMPLTI